MIKVNGLTVALMRAASFLGTKGVNLGGLSSYSIRNQSTDLEYLGIVNVRAGWIMPSQRGYDSIQQVVSIIAAAHAKFDFIDEQFSSISTLEPPAQLASYDSLEAAAPGSIGYIEGLNEINDEPVTYDGGGSFGQGQDELNAAMAYQQTIYQATADTQHPYVLFGQAPSYWVNPALAFPNLTAADIAAGAQMIHTETGYSSVPDGYRRQRGDSFDVI